MDGNYFTEVPLVSAPETIRGLKLLQRVKVAAGTAKVVTLDGVYRETLWPGNNWLPGGYWLGRYMPMTECQIYTVDTKDKQQSVKADLKIQINQNQSLMEATLDVVVSYRVSLPHKVALQVTTPLGFLRSWTVEAMNDTAKRLGYFEFLTNSRIGDDILQCLIHNDAEQQFGLQIFNVQIHKPDAPLLPTIIDLLRDEKILNNAIKMTVNPMPLLPDLYPTGVPKEQPGIQGPIDRPQLESGGPSPYIAFAEKKLKEECATLLDRDYRPSLKKGADGYYLVEIERNNRDEHHLRIGFACRKSYPQDPPQVVFVEVDGVEQNFNSLIVGNWSSDRTIFEIVEEIQVFFNR